MLIFVNSKLIIFNYTFVNVFISYIIIKNLLNNISNNIKFEIIIILINVKLQLPLYNQSKNINDLKIKF